MPHANTLVLIVISNILPLAGVLLAGWDIYTLLVFYWCETLIVAFWTVMTIAFHQGEQTWSFDGPTARTNGAGGVAATFITLHAGFFLAIHLFLMNALYGGDWQGSMRSPLVFFETFVIGERLWPMLGLVFLHRGAIFLEERREKSVMPAIAGLYMRIVVMQIVIIIGAWGVMLTGSGMLGLILLVAGRAILDFQWPRLVRFGMIFMEPKKKY